MITRPVILILVGGWLMSNKEWHQTTFSPTLFWTWSKKMMFFRQILGHRDLWQNCRGPWTADKRERRADKGEEGGPDTAGRAQEFQAGDAEWGERNLSWTSQWCRPRAMWGKDFWFNPCSIMRGFLFVFFKLGLAEKAEGWEFQVPRRPECVQRATLHRNWEDKESVPGTVSISSFLVLEY